MLSNLDKEVTPYAKRKLVNEAFDLALHALSTFKDPPDALDETYIFSYLFYHVHYR